MKLSEREEKISYVIIFHSKRAICAARTDRINKIANQHTPVIKSSRFTLGTAEKKTFRIRLMQQK